MPDLLHHSRSHSHSHSHHGRILGAIDVEAPDGRTVEARLRVVEGDRVSAAELAALDTLFQRGFGTWPDFEVGGSSLDHLHWKIAGPKDRPNYSLLWEVEGEIVCGCIKVFRELRVRGMARMGHIGADGTVGPPWRGQGLSAHRDRIAAPFFAERSAVNLGTTNNARGVHFLAGNRVLYTPIRVLLSVNDPRRVAVAWRERGGRRLPRPAVAAALWGMRVVTTLRGFKARHRLRRTTGVQSAVLRTAERFDSRVDALFEAAARDFDLIVVRGHDYLNWRFCDERGGRYTLLLAEAEQGDELLGYVVTRRDGNRGYVVDVLAKPGRLDVVDALLDGALRELRDGGAAGVVCWMVADHPYMPALRRHGFFDSRRDPRFLFHPYGLAADEFAFLWEPGARVHLTHGDTDVI